MKPQAGSPVIGVFDSGVGGLTVLRALRRTLPQASYLYLGDTARLPYGSKSRATVARYAVESALFLVEQGASYLVIACNTASALALDEIRAAVPVPVLGVIETGADAALMRSLTADVLVIATTATVASHAYQAACRERGLRVLEMACPLLVPLVEEGWTAHPVTRDVLRLYLAELAALAEAAGLKADALVLGCTHYPLLRAEIEALVAPGMSVIDSAEVTAIAVARTLDRPEMDIGTGHGTSLRKGLGKDLGMGLGKDLGEGLGEGLGESLRKGLGEGIGMDLSSGRAAAPVRFYATDGVERFRELGSRFLSEPIDNVILVDLGG